MDLKFRDLKADEIELRVGSTKRKFPGKPKGEDNPVIGFQLLLYKNARVDANILDETVGAFNWTKKYYQVKNTMFCEVGIRDTNTGEWVYKSDAGDDDFQTEQVKGEASDSFKRAAFAWGLGRKNLYYGPFIWINCDNDINEFSKLYVSEIEYQESIIAKLVIKERNTDKVVYSYPKGRNVSQTSEKPQNNNLNTLSGTINAKQRQLIEAKLLTFNDEQRQKFFKWLNDKCQTMSVDVLSESQAERVCIAWKLS